MYQYVFRLLLLFIGFLLTGAGFAKGGEIDYLRVEMATPDGWQGKRLCNEKYMSSQRHEKVKIWIHTLQWGEQAKRAIEKGECDFIPLDASFNNAIQSRDVVDFFHVLKKKSQKTAPDMEFTSEVGISAREGMSSYQHESSVVENGVPFMKWEVLFVRRDSPLAHYWSYMAPQQLYGDYLETATKSLRGLEFLPYEGREQAPEAPVVPSKQIPDVINQAPMPDTVIEQAPQPPETEEPAAALGPAPVHACDHLAADPDDPEIAKVAAIGVLWPLMAAKEAVNSCRAAVAAYPHEPRFAFQLGRALRRDSQLLEAVKWYRKAADRDYAAAHAGVGDAYYSGWGVPVDISKARENWLKAVGKGHIDAMLSLAMSYETGDGASKDPVTAMTWYRKAAEKGHPVAMFMVGRKYENGEGVRADLSQAISWYQRAAEKGQGDACALLGYKYLAGHGVSQNPEMAGRWYVEAVANGHWEPIDPDYLGITLSKKAVRQYWRAVQTQLRDGYVSYQGKIDGKKGPKTQRALDELKEQAKKAGRVSIFSP